MADQKQLAGDTTTKVCRRCGATFHGNFCAICGAKAQEEITFCPVCGLDREKGAGFCFNCGFSYIQEAPSDVTATPKVKETPKAQASPQPDVPEATPVQEETVAPQHQSAPVPVPGEQPKKEVGKQAKRKGLSKKAKIITCVTGIAVVVVIAVVLIFGLATPPESGTINGTISYELTKLPKESGGNTSYALHISGTGDLELEWAKYPWHEYRQNIKNVVIENGVTSIGSNAFDGCTGLTSMEIPNSVKSIGSYAFYNCKGLTSVTIPDSVTSIASSTFYGCAGLTSITIPDSVTSIGNYTFYDCIDLASIEIPDGVTSIGSEAFRGCEDLTSVNIGSNVTSIGNSAFYGCTGLTSITIPDSVTSIGSFAFYDCVSLRTVSIHTTGWYRTTSSTAGTSVDLSNSSTVATYLRSTYSDCSFKRTT